MWIGNADYTPMVNTTGLTGAAPIWSSFMTICRALSSPTMRRRPFNPAWHRGTGDLCPLRHRTFQYVPRWQRSEFFASDQPPLPKGQDLFRRVNIDTWTGLIAGDACKDFAKEDMTMNVSDKFARDWLRSGDGREWLEAHDMPRNPSFSSDRECKTEDPHPVLEFQNPTNGATITTTTIPVSGVIDVKNGGFTGWRLEYGAGGDPLGMDGADPGKQRLPATRVDLQLGLTTVQGNQVTLRLYLMNGEDGYAERKVTINLSLPTPTASPTLSPTAIPPTAFPTDTPVPVENTPTETLIPSRPPKRQSQRTLQDRRLCSAGHVSEVLAEDSATCFSEKYEPNEWTDPF